MSNYSSTIFPTLLLFLLIASSLEPGYAQECADPLAAVLTTLDCVEQKNATCATAGYNPVLFKKLHNGIDTNTVIGNDETFWTGAFLFTDLRLDYDFQMNVDTNKVSLRYVETVTTLDGTNFGLPPSDEYPFGQVYVQHEYALVTVDDDCKMILWDQYGDNEEQLVVDNAVNALLCILGFLPSEACPPPATTSDVPSIAPTRGPSVPPTTYGPSVPPTTSSSSDWTRSMVTAGFVCLSMMVGAHFV